MDDRDELEGVLLPCVMMHYALFIMIHTSLLSAMLPLYRFHYFTLHTPHSQGSCHTKQRSREDT